MITLLVTYWEPKSGYVIKWITEREEIISNDLLELIFFRALGFPERRVESMYWVQNFFGQSYHCYYLGAHTEVPIIIIGHGGTENLVKSVIYDLAMRIRSVKLDELNKKLPYNYSRVIRNLSQRTLKLFVLNNELILRTYLIILESPVIRYDELLEQVFHEKIASSIKDLDDALTLLNIIGFVRIFWVMGSKWVELSKVLVPLRKPKSKFIFENIFKEYFNKRSLQHYLFKEINYSTNIFIDPVLRKLIVDLKKRRQINYESTMRKELDFLIQASYAIKHDETIYFNTEPVIKIFNIAGVRVQEFNI